MVTYKDNHIHVATGDVVLFSNRFIWHKPITWLAAIIHFFTGVEYNHAGIVVYNWGVPFIVESLGRGIICRPLEKYLQRTKTNIVVLRHNRSFQEKELATRAMKACGIGYDYSNLLLHQLVYRTTGFWIGRQSTAFERMVCTEFAAWCHGLNNWHLYSAKEFLSHPDFETVFLEETPHPDTAV